MAKREATIQREIRDYLRNRGWLVYVTTCGSYMKGLPDLICHHPEHGTRLVDVKRPKGGTLTKAQVQVWTEFEKYKLGVWIMTECDESVLFGPPNWRQWWKPRYEKWVTRNPWELLEDDQDHC